MNGINYFATPLIGIKYVLSLNEKDLKQIREAFDIPENVLILSETQGLAQIIFGENQRLIVVQINDADINCQISLAALIVHEATHVKQFLCDEIGEQSPSAEFEAYTVQEITYNLLREYQNRNAKGFLKQDAFTLELEKPDVTSGEAADGTKN